MDPQLISTCEFSWARVQPCLWEQLPGELSLTPISFSQSPLAREVTENPSRALLIARTHIPGQVPLP